MVYMELNATAQPFCAVLERHLGRTLKSFKFQLKKHEPGTVQETPQGRDGNQERVAAELDEKGRRKSVIFA